MKLPVSITFSNLRKKFSSPGFTMIELLVVMTVISLLATMVLFGMDNAQKSARDAQRQQIMTAIQGALEKYYGDNQTYPVVNAPNPFCALITTLTGGSNPYLTTAPNDPQTQKSICLGGLPSSVQYYYEAPQTIHGSNTNTCTANPADFPAKVYQLALTKESGGANYYCSP